MKVNLEHRKEVDSCSIVYEYSSTVGAAAIKRRLLCGTNPSPLSQEPTKESVFKSRRISQPMASQCSSDRATSSKGRRLRRASELMPAPSSSTSQIRAP